MLTDIQIAQQTPCEPITEIAKKLNIDADDLEMYGKYKAKLPLSLNKKYADRENGKLILVTAINPTPAGEGKTRWLVEKAFKEVNNGKKVVFLSEDTTEFEKFARYYRTLFAMYCPVVHATTPQDVPAESVVLIDELVIKLVEEKIDISILKEKCSNIFVTVEGKTID